MLLLLLVSTATAMTPPKDPELDFDQIGIDGYRTHNYRSPTPASSAEAWTVSTDEARQLIDSGRALPVDVQAARVRPALGDLPAAWMPSRPRLHIPGSVWLPNVGYPDLQPELDHWYQRHLERITEGKRDRGLLIYCVVDCWLAWNAVRRAASYGYDPLYWYPDGSDGWAEAGLPLVPAQPVPPPPGVRPISAGGGL